jgi:hypothetical protein
VTLSCKQQGPRPLTSQSRLAAHSEQSDDALQAGSDAGPVCGQCRPDRPRPDLPPARVPRLDRNRYRVHGHVCRRPDGEHRHQERRRRPAAPRLSRRRRRGGRRGRRPGGALCPRSVLLPFPLPTLFCCADRPLFLTHPQRSTLSCARPSATSSCTTPPSSTTRCRRRPGGRPRRRRRHGSTATSARAGTSSLTPGWRRPLRTSSTTAATGSARRSAGRTAASFRPGSTPMTSRRTAAIARTLPVVGAEIRVETAASVGVAARATTAGSVPGAPVGIGATLGRTR